MHDKRLLLRPFARPRTLAVLITAATTFQLMSASILSRSGVSTPSPGHPFSWKAEMIWPGLKDDQLQFFRTQKVPEEKKHVHLMHLDGYRADIVEKMLTAGQLPHMAFLLSRGEDLVHGIDNG